MEKKVCKHCSGSLVSLSWIYCDRKACTAERNRISYSKSMQKKKKTNSEPKKLELTNSLRTKLDILFALEESKTIVMKLVGLFRNKYDATSVIEITSAVAKSKRDFWNEAGEVYPETKSGIWSANLSGK